MSNHNSSLVYEAINFNRYNGGGSERHPAGPLDPFFNTNRPEDLAEAERFAAI